MESLKEIYLLAAKRILRYIWGTTDFQLFYNKGGKSKLFGFCDSDYAGDLDDKRITTGYAFVLGFAVLFMT